MKNVNILFSSLDRRWPVKEGQKKGVWVNNLLVWDWWFIMPEWNLSSLPVDSLIYQNQTQVLTISRRSWKQGSDGLVLIKGWLWKLLEPPAAIPVDSIVVILKCFYFFLHLSHDKQAVCSGRKMTRGDPWENSQSDSIIYTCRW